MVGLYTGGDEVSNFIRVAIILAQLNNYQFFCCAVVLFVSRRKESVFSINRPHCFMSL